MTPGGETKYRVTLVLSEKDLDDLDGIFNYAMCHLKMLMHEANPLYNREGDLKWLAEVTARHDTVKRIRQELEESADLVELVEEP